MRTGRQRGAREGSLEGEREGQGVMAGRAEGRLAEQPGFHPEGTGPARRPGAGLWLELHVRKTTMEAASRSLS